MLSFDAVFLHSLFQSDDLLIQHDKSFFPPPCPHGSVQKTSI